MWLLLLDNSSGAVTPVFHTKENLTLLQSNGEISQISFDVFDFGFRHLSNFAWCFGFSNLFGFENEERGS